MLRKDMVSTLTYELLEGREWQKWNSEFEYLWRPKAEKMTEVKLMQSAFNGICTFTRAM